MKKRLSFRNLLLCSLLAAAPFVYENAFANEATNCAYTGNSSDYCNASDGTNNLRVTNCRPGTTSCSYTPPTKDLEIGG